MESKKFFNEDWKVLSKFFPAGWKAQAYQLKAFNRTRGVKSINILLRILLIHLADGCSLRETAARAKQAKLANISDVALLNRLKSSSEWFRWMSQALLQNSKLDLSQPSWLQKFNVKSVDASVITEPGSTGTDWRLHYCYNLFSLNCEDFKITKPDIGESFINYSVRENDLFIGDRAYGRLKGLSYIKGNQGEFVARYMHKAFSLLKDGDEFKILNELSSLKYGEIGEWEIEGATKSGLMLPMRLCVIKKSEEQSEQAIKKAKYEAKKKGRLISEETLELHRYVILLTSLPKDISAKFILELYRLRWQIEIAFKRMKSILGFGHLPKKDSESCKAWLHGKLFISLLAQAIVDEGRQFSPWGYPIK